MMFRDLKEGNVLYIYDRSAIDVRVQKVESVSAPKIDRASGVAGMVVDVTAGGVVYSLKDTGEVGYNGNLIISADKTSILREVESQKANNETIIGKVDMLKAELPKLESVIDMLDPDVKAKKQNEERLTRLEDSIGSLKEMMQVILNKKNETRTDSKGAGADK